MTRWMIVGFLLLAAPSANAAGLVDLVQNVDRINLLVSTPHEVAVAAGVAVGVCGDAGEALRQTRPGATAIMFLPIPPRCDEKGEVVGLQLNPVPVAAAAMARLRAVLRPEFGSPCYTGSLPSNARRRAPPPFTTIWAHGSRILAVTREFAGAAQATVLYADLGPRPERFATVVSTLERLLPPACLTSRNG